ncbi:MAG TPA: TorF family putative porin [Sphingobium sp.]|nr:TorF family putative porin [Sphingobium sp.]
MRKSILGLSALSLFAVSAPALAQDDAASASPITISGSVGLVSDYRFRGFAQSSENAAIQGGITVSHDSGFYAGTWGSSVTFAGGAEVDLFAGYSKEIAPGVTADVGLLYYLYPKHGGGDTDFFEPYASLTGAIGPATLKVGVNYAWAQDALVSLKDGSKASALYLHAEPSIGIPNTPFTLDGHIGYAVSDAFPGGGGNDHHVWDYSIGGSVAYRNLSFGIHYVDTDEARVRANAAGSDGAVIFSLTASF